MSDRHTLHEDDRLLSVSADRGCGETEDVACFDAFEGGVERDCADMMALMRAVPGAHPAGALACVQFRSRTILMTGGSTIVGMIPIVLEWAVGIERLSPLAVVTIGGQIAGTFLTLLVVPVLFHTLESRWRGINRAQARSPGTVMGNQSDTRFTR